MRVLITGATGMLGGRVADEGRRLGHDVTGLGSSDLDITDAQAVFDVIAGEQPDAVIHCAAYTDVDGAESEEDKAMRVNGDGTSHVTAAAGRHGAFVVFVSTDYVFAGDADEPYVESSAPAPRTAYGRSKLAGEAVLREIGTPAAIARTAWLYGAGGRNFVDTMLELGAERDEVSVVADQIGCPTWTGHLAPALLEIAERRLEGIHHVAGGGWCSWHDFAKEAFELAGVACRLDPVSTEEFPRPAPRPAWSVLGSERPDAIALPQWQEGLAAYLKERVAA